MPIYEYFCPKCEETFEEFQSNFEERDAECPECGCASKRQISNTSFILKGSGWYVTDYARGNGSGGNGAETKSDTNGTNGKNGTAEKSTQDSKSDSSSTTTSSASSTTKETKSSTTSSTPSK